MKVKKMNLNLGVETGSPAFLSSLLDFLISSSSKPLVSLCFYFIIISLHMRSRDLMNTVVQRRQRKNGVHALHHVND